ncbi:hypothetical protein [Amycolatopsis sp. NPDC051716]|uniref:hypothetical protein n=1 Tax=Amycolatopsis sp. NPDC051716 TaxID=3155804 RepID=UPI0034413127
MNDDVGVSRRRWFPWAAAGAVTAVAGGGTLWVGLLRAQQAKPLASVTNSVVDATNIDVVLQAGSIGGAVTAGDGNLVGDHDLVAGPGGIVAGPGVQAWSAGRSALLP